MDKEEITLSASDPKASWFCRTEALIKSGKVPDVTIVDAQKNYKKALEKGVLKILSKVCCWSAFCCASSLYHARAL